MNKKFLPLVFFASTIVCCQNLYAHNDNAIQEKEAEKKAAEDKQSSDDWGDFMSAIKAQEKTPKAENENDKSELPNQ